jgi:integrase/recombinase XerD
LCGIKFFYERTLSREWKVFELVRPVREKKLPAILSRDEVRRILGCVRLPVYRACLTTIYVCGLRLQEGAQLQVADVDSARGLLHIHGKGRRDRYVPVPGDARPMLREHWRTHRSPVLSENSARAQAARCESTQSFMAPDAGGNAPARWPRTADC